MGIKILGIDPGLRHTGWGLIEVQANQVKHVANGTIHTSQSADSKRLAEIHVNLFKVIETHQPDEVAIEDTFANKNSKTSLKLGQARGVILCVPELFQLPISEYKPNKIKKTVTGAGHADKEQIHQMLKLLIPGCEVDSADAADALAIAICHSQHRQIQSYQERYA